MARTLKLYPNTVPEGVCLTDAQSVINLGAKYLTAQTDENYTYFVQSATTPSADDQDKIWFKFDANNLYLGTFFYYNGAWRKVCNNAAGDVIMYSGITSGVFDGTGLGLAGGVKDGWAIMNGSNGTADLRDKFVIGAYQLDAGVWKTNVTGSLTQTGGEATHLLTVNELPEFTVEEVQSHTTKAPGYPGNSNETNYNEERTIGGGVAHNNLPPYYALALIQFIGY